MHSLNEYDKNRPLKLSSSQKRSVPLEPVGKDKHISSFIIVLVV